MVWYRHPAESCRVAPPAAHASHSAGPRVAPARLLYLLSAASVVPAFLDGARTYVKELMDDRPGIAWNAVLFQGAEWLFLGALLPITYGMAARFPLRRGALARALLPHLAGAMLLCVGWATGADVDARAEYWGSQVTPLHMAAGSGSANILRLLLDAGAVRAFMTANSTAIAVGWAEHFRRSEVLRILTDQLAKS